MTPLSPAQLRQRQKAATRHAGYSAPRIAELSATNYARLLKRCTYSSGPTSLRTRLAIQKVAHYRARIQLAEDWLDQQADPMFKNRATGELWPIHARIEEWSSAEARYLAQLPADVRRSRPRLAGLRRR